MSIQPGHIFESPWGNYCCGGGAHHEYSWQTNRGGKGLGSTAMPCDCWLLQDINIKFDWTMDGGGNPHEQGENGELVGANGDGGGWHDANGNNLDVKKSEFCITLEARCCCVKEDDPDASDLPEMGEDGQGNPNSNNNNENNNPDSPGDQNNDGHENAGNEVFDTGTDADGNMTVSLDMTFKFRVGCDKCGKKADCNDSWIHGNDPNDINSNIDCEKGSSCCNIKADKPSSKEEEDGASLDGHGEAKKCGTSEGGDNPNTGGGVGEFGGGWSNPNRAWDMDYGSHANPVAVGWRLHGLAQDILAGTAGSESTKQWVQKNKGTCKECREVKCKQKRAPETPPFV